MFRVKDLWPSVNWAPLMGISKIKIIGYWVVYQSPLLTETVVSIPPLEGSPNLHILGSLLKGTNHQQGRATKALANNSEESRVQNLGMTWSSSSCFYMYNASR